MITTSRTAASAASLPTAPAAIFALLGLIDIALLGVVGSAVAPPLGVSIIIAGLGLVTLVALIPAPVHGSQRALVTAVAARLISALLAAAAFFAGAPAWVMAVEAFVIAATVAALVLLHGRPGCREPDHGPHPLDPGRRRPRARRLVVQLPRLGGRWPARPRPPGRRRRWDHRPHRHPGGAGAARDGRSPAPARAPLVPAALHGRPAAAGCPPSLLTAGLDLAPVGLALSAMVGGYAVSGRGPLWVRSMAGLIAVGAIVAPFAAPKPYPDLSVTTPYGAWAATLASSLFVALALACSIPMRAPDPIQAPGESRWARPI